MYICRFVCMCRAWRIAAKAPQPKQHAALPGHHWSPNTLGLRPKTLNLGPQTHKAKIINTLQPKTQYMET